MRKIEHENRENLSEMKMRVVSSKSSAEEKKNVLFATSEMRYQSTHHVVIKMLLCCHIFTRLSTFVQ